MSTKHAPLPWKFNVALLREARIYIPKTNGLLYLRNEDVKSDDFNMADNAEFIVRACNSHYEMLEELWHEFICLGKDGANADLNHPKRQDWERKRALIQKAMGDVSLGEDKAIAKATGEDR